MPCMLLEDGMVPANACTAPGSIDEVIASWLTGSILGVPSAFMIEPSLDMDSKILEAEEQMDVDWCLDDDDGTTGGRAMFALPCQLFPKSCALKSSFCARSSSFCLRR